MARRDGFSLIELLVATAIAGLASVYMFGSVISSNRAYTVIDQVSESQQGMRAVASLLESDLRHAGMMVPIGAAFCGVDNTNEPDVLYVSDASAIDPDGDLIPYDGAEGPVGMTNVTTPTDTIALSSLIIEPSPPTRAAYDTDGNGTNDSDFQPGGGAIVFDANSPSRGTACGQIETVNLGTPSVTIKFASADLGASGGGEEIIVIPAHEYRLDGDRLLRNGMLLAEGVEDLQFALFLDADDDAVIDANEMEGDGAGGDYTAKDTDMSTLREIRVNLVVRTRGEDSEFDGQPQIRENRAAAGTDGFRRRVHTSTVRVRNMVRDS